MIKIKKVTDPSFRKYGKIVENVEFSQLVAALNAKTPVTDEVVYQPSVEVLEKLPVYKELQNKTFGECPIQIGFCNGRNDRLNALEYHRSSEINVAGTDAILLLGSQQDITDEFTYDTSLTEAFLLPKGIGVEIYATTLHYAPCGVDGKGFQVAIILPKGTNLPLEEKHEGDGEDKLLAATNKWLIGHPEGGLDKGSYIGLIGENISVK